ncbi:MAG: GxxExxY protein [Candidatus Edwardsbacteria bacterium]|jgi:GxxExxY protein|nr:GxxExxY protein [Candidatus Edwardsbacteria bacterium]
MKIVKAGLEHAGLTEKIIGAAIGVHKALGPGFLESVYENALVVALRDAGLPHEQQREVPVTYNGIQVGLHRLDLLVAGLIVVELKAVKDIEDVHFAVVRSYLKALNLKHGLLLNFSKKTLEVRRVIHE